MALPLWAEGHAMVPIATMTCNGRNRWHALNPLTGCTDWCRTFPGSSYDSAMNLAGNSP